MLPGEVAEQVCAQVVRALITCGRRFIWRESYKK